MIEEGREPQGEILLSRWPEHARFARSQVWWKQIFIATEGVEDAILGSSNFTVRGLGLGNAGNNIELNLIVDSNRDRQELKQWFDELWGNETLVRDVKQDVLSYLKQLYENNAPEFIYYKTLFHIFEKFIGDAGKSDADLGKTSLFETK